jgi:hypothetical protein
MSLLDRGLEVTAKVYSSKDSFQVLRVDLTANGYVPVEVTIQNQGNHSYAISAASTAMSSAKPKDVAWKFSKKRIPHAIGLKILSLFFWPFTIVGTIDSIHSYKKNKSLVKALTAKGFKEVDEVVLPYSVVKRLLYIPEELFYQTFTVALEDLSADELVVVPVEAT